MQFVVLLVLNCRKNDEWKLKHLKKLTYYLHPISEVVVKTFICVNNYHFVSLFKVYDELAKQ